MNVEALLGTQWGLNTLGAVGARFTANTAQPKKKLTVPRQNAKNGQRLGADSPLILAGAV
jgi:hypothetical protein